MLLLVGGIAGTSPATTFHEEKRSGIPLGAMTMHSPHFVRWFILFSYNVRFT